MAKRKSQEPTAPWLSFLELKEWIIELVVNI